MVNVSLKHSKSVKSYISVEIKGTSLKIGLYLFFQVWQAQFPATITVKSFI